MPRAKAAKQVEEEDLIEAEPPTSINPYEVLSVPKDATDDQIKKAYRKAALRHHPDKATGTDAATAHTDFQRIAFAYSILSSPSRRSHYDRTGSTTESALEDDDFNWSDFFRARYEEVTVSALDKFLLSYKNSSEERADLLKAYTDAKGNMDKVYESVMGSNVLEDDDRFRGIIDAAIGEGETEGFDKYVNESQKSKGSRRKKAEKEAEEAEKEAEKRAKKKKKAEEDEAQSADAEKGAKAKRGAGKKQKGGDAESDLVAMIQKRQTERGGNFLDRLEAKYAGEEAETKQKKKGGRKRKQEVDDDEDEGVGRLLEEPSEEAFKAMGDRMQKAKKARR